MCSLRSRGVGPKCAGLALGIALRQPYIGVDIHVHRVTNRWGYVTAKTPEKTMDALQQKLPKEYWGGNQPTAGVLWQTRVPGHCASLFRVRVVGYVRTTGSDKSSLILGQYINKIEKSSFT